MRVVYGFVAMFLIVVAVGGARINMEQIAKNQGLPNDPAQRQAYIIGMFIPTVGILALGMGFGFLAVRNRNKPDQRE